MTSVWTPEDGPPDVPLIYDVPEAHENGTAPVLEIAPKTRIRLIDAAELLAEPDPGPTAWLVDNLIVDRAIIAFVGRWKTTKSYGLLHLCISIATGQPAFGSLAVPSPGPVIFVNEESGRAAMWRRLDSLCRGRAIDPEQLRDKLFVGPNLGVRLDDKGWQDELIAIGRELQPRLFAFDPLARMKAPSRKENAQEDMAEPIEFLRKLREATGSAAGFVHHTGHQGDTMRGSSDLESFWETRLAWKRDGQAPIVTVEAEHREAEAGEPIRYRINWDPQTRSMRFDLVDDKEGLTLSDRILHWLQHEGPGDTDEVRAAMGNRRADVLRNLEALEEHGTVHRGTSEGRDALGRTTRRKVWKAGGRAEMSLETERPEGGTERDGAGSGGDRATGRPSFLKLGGTDGPPDAASRADEDIPF